MATAFENSVHQAAATLAGVNKSPALSADPLDAEIPQQKSNLHLFEDIGAGWVVLSGGIKL